MPTIELVSHALCPYVQRAVIALTEKNVPFTRTVIDLADKPQWFKAISPLGKVPLLKVDDTVLFESAVICEYLDETIEPRLHPAAPLERARHRTFVELASAVLNDIWRLYTAPGHESFTARITNLSDRFAHIENALDGPYFSGRKFSLVDAAFGPAFRYFDVFDRYVDLPVFADLPKVRKWRAALAERESVRSAVSADYHKRLVDFVIAQKSHLGHQLSNRKVPA